MMIMAATRVENRNSKPPLPLLIPGLVVEGIPFWPHRGPTIIPVRPREMMSERIGNSSLHVTFYYNNLFPGT